jgi:hypothetical protein
MIALRRHHGDWKIQLVMFNAGVAQIRAAARIGVVRGRMRD